MNLEESNSYQDNVESRDRKKRGVMLSIILCGVLIALLFIMIVIISYQDSITEKFFINGTQTSKLSNKIYGAIDGVVYIDVKELSSVLGYTYTKGEYKKYNENEDSCYLQNDFEIITLTSGDNNYNKYIEISNNATLAEIQVTSKNSPGYYENYKIENPIVYENGKIYVPLDSLPKMFNVSIDWQEYRKYIYTLEEKIQKAQKIIAKYNYQEMSGYYENLRAIMDGYVIVGDAEVAAQNASKYYGVFSLNDTAEIISLKYDEIIYTQNVEEFYIKAENGTMGILDNTGGTIIAPSEFEEISLLDEENQLYLVKKDNEYGVVNRNGKVLVYAENDKIGLDEQYISEFTLDTIENPNMLFGKCIPVQKDGNFGLYNKDGNMILNLLYQGFGYKSSATSRTSGNEQSVLLIPSSVGINGIVINLGDLYGVFDINTESIILPCVYDKIYAITKNGKTTYYADWGGNTIDLKDYLKSEGLNNVSEDDKKTNKSSSDNENTVSSNNTVSSSNNTVMNETVDNENNNVANSGNDVIVIETN